MSTAEANSLPDFRSSPKAIPNGLLGMLIFILTEIMVFAALISAYLVHRSSACRANSEQVDSS